jgi:hypothetical protein
MHWPGSFVLRVRSSRGRSRRAPKPLHHRCIPAHRSLRALRARPTMNSREQPKFNAAYFFVSPIAKDFSAIARPLLATARHSLARRLLLTRADCNARRSQLKEFKTDVRYDSTIVMQRVVWQCVRTTPEACVWCHGLSAGKRWAYACGAARDTYFFALMFSFLALTIFSDWMISLKTNQRSGLVRATSLYYDR